VSCRRELSRRFRQEAVLRGLSPKTRFWHGVLVVLAAVNLAAVWFAARAGA